jgi:hypothetical protein
MWSNYFRRGYSILTYAYRYGMFLFKKGYNYFIKESKPSKPVDVIEEYCQKHKKKFLQTLELTTLVVNKNIDPVFYVKSDFQSAIRDDNNALENDWKTRILFENTPRGNVIMYYNPFKLGFTYYADQYIPYDILNAVAMKYVITYRCMDFFMDEVILPETKKSPLMVLLEEDKKDDKKEDTEFKNMLKGAPFAKLKNHKKEDKKKVDNTKEKQKERNRFIHMGKIQNYKFLKIPEKKAVNLFTTTSALVASLHDNTGVQQSVFSYRDYKKVKRDTICTDVNCSTL